MLKFDRYTSSKLTNNWQLGSSSVCEMVPCYNKTNITANNTEIMKCGNVGQACVGQNSITSDLWHQERPANLPQIQNLEVMCAKDHMEVQLSFDRPFYGLVFSKGQFGSDNCVYVQPNTGSVNFRFSIIYNGCGITVLPWMVFGWLLSWRIDVKVPNRTPRASSTRTRW